MLTRANFIVQSLFAQLPPGSTPVAHPKTAVGPYYDAVAILLIVLPLIVVANGFGKIWRYKKWRAKAQLAQGDQRGWEIRGEAGPAGTDFPVIVFVANNKSYRCKNCVGFNAHPEILPTKLLGVLYNPDNPEDSYQNTNENFPSVLLWLISSGAISGASLFAWMVFLRYFVR